MLLLFRGSNLVSKKCCVCATVWRQCVPETDTPPPTRTSRPPHHTTNHLALLFFPGLNAPWPEPRVCRVRVFYEYESLIRVQEVLFTTRTTISTMRRVPRCQEMISKSPTGREVQLYTYCTSTSVQYPALVWVQFENQAWPTVSSSKFKTQTRTPAALSYRALLEESI